MMLNLNCALILLPVCRNFCSWLRATPIAASVPYLDDPIAFHKLVGGMIALAAVGHCTFHFLDFVWARDTHGTSVGRQLFLTRAGLTGFVVLVIMFVMAITSVDFRLWNCCPARTEPTTTILQMYRSIEV